LVGAPAVGDDPQHGVGRRSPRLTGYNRRRAHQNVTWRTVNAAVLCWPSDDIAFEKINFCLRWGGSLLTGSERDDADNDWQDAGTG